MTLYWGGRRKKDLYMMELAAQWAKDIPYLTYQGKVYGVPAVINADSMIALEDKVGNVDSYGVVFDPKLKGKTAMEDAWINSAIFTAIYLKNSENAKIAEPGNLTPDELGLVMEFLIKHKKDGQFRTFWSGWEQGVQLVANTNAFKGGFRLWDTRKAKKISG